MFDLFLEFVHFVKFDSLVAVQLSRSNRYLKNISSASLLGEYIKNIYKEKNVFCKIYAKYDI